MKKNTLLIILLIITFSANAQKRQQSSKSVVLELSSVVDLINRSITQASKELSKTETKLKIKEAAITLETVYDLSGGGEFKLFAKASKKWELEKTTSITFSYSSEEKSNSKSGTSSPMAFEQNLTNAIISAAKQWKQSTGTITELIKDNFNVEVSFMVKKSTGIGVEFEVWGVGADLSVDNENSATHKVSLTFE